MDTLGRNHLECVCVLGGGELHPTELSPREKV